MPKRLLVIDPIAPHRIKMAAVLEGAQYDVVTAATTAEARAHLAAIPPDLIISGSLPDETGEQTAENLPCDFAGDAPLLCLDSEAGPVRRLRALRCGARDLLARALPDALLLARVRGLIREGEARREIERRRMTAASFGFAEANAGFQRRSQIVCIGGDQEGAGAVDALLAGLPHDVQTLDADRILRDDYPDHRPDAYVIFCGGKTHTTLDSLLPELRVRSHSRHASILVLHEPANYETAIRALNLGATEIASLDSSNEELAIRIDAMLSRKRAKDALRQSAERSYHLATTDSLTGLFNRRYAEAYLADVLARAKDSGRDFIVMMVDIDHFKRVNDTFGHAAGDRVLRAVACKIRDNLRAFDLVARIGGEEFLIVLPETDGAEASMAADRLRGLIAHDPVALDDGTEVPVTVSIGAAVGAASQRPRAEAYGSLRKPDQYAFPHVASLMEHADQALYRAKSSGRNRVDVSPYAA